MIIRNKRQPSETAEEITFSLALTVADVRKWLEHYYTLAGLLAFSESDFIYFLQHSHLKEFPDKHSEWICNWAWNTAIRHEFITPSDVSEGSYYVSVRNVLPRQGVKK